MRKIHLSINGIYEHVHLESKKLLDFLRASEYAFLGLFSVMAGISAGYGAVIFRSLIGFFTWFFFNGCGRILEFMGPFRVIFSTALGGLIVGLLIRYFAKEAKGHGVPEVMLAVASLGGRIRFRVAGVKALASAICIGSGGSVGREGPIVQISSALGSGLGQLFRLDDEKIKVLVACGAAGGIAATFNAPIAGTFFALEVILRRYSQKFFSAIVLSSMIATLISRHYLGNHPAFDTPNYQFLNLWETPLYVLFGLIAGLIAVFYIKCLYGFEDLFEKIRIPDFVRSAIGGAIVGTIGVWYPQIFGTGYDIIELTLFGKIGVQLVVMLLFLKIIATSITVGSGGSGGVFAPALFIGAMLGEAFGKITYMVIPDFVFPPGAVALVGMAAVFAAAAQAPFSAVLILFEMTGDYQIILPLMVTCVISTLVAKKLSRESIYTMKLVRRGINIQDMRDVDPLDLLKVSSAMITTPVTVRADATVDSVLDLIERTGHKGFPVVDEKGDLVGMISSLDLHMSLSRPAGDLRPGDRRINEIMTKDIVSCNQGDSLRLALELIAGRHIGRMPVVEEGNTSHMIGLVTRKSIIDTYYDECSRQKKLCSRPAPESGKALDD